jgi:cysteine-rich repeat protein
MKNGRTTSAMLVAFLLVQAGIAQADEAADRCGSSKMKATARYAQTVLKCNSQATKNGEPVDSLCVSKAGLKLVSAFEKAEAAGGCATADDEGSVETSFGADADAIVLALEPDPNDDARRCAASKMKAAGKQIGAILKCYSRGANNSEAPDPECIATTYEKLVKSFSSAESKGGCSTTGDVEAIDTLDTNAAEDQVEALSPVCGDSIIGPTQDCEVGNAPACPALCTSACECQSLPDCGDGVAELPEECDDGANMDGDGCSAACQLEDARGLCAGIASIPGTAINAVLVSSAFNSPVYATAPPLDPARLFVVEREGLIRILNLADNTVEPTPFLDIADLTTTDGERGLFSIAFDPEYDTPRRFFVYYTNNSGSIVIARYEADTMNLNAADESTAQVLLTIPHPGESNHNGGQVAFGPDGYLYAATGDGGGGGDPGENAQDNGSLLGKMLRIDIDVDVPPYYAVPPSNPFFGSLAGDFRLIWARGLRNPFRFSFDFESGDLLIADVGQDQREEINFQDVSSLGGENYGWDIFEGNFCHEPEPPAMTCPMPPVGFTFPIFQYDHATPSCESITGGFVYRGCAMPDFVDTYFFSDACQNFIRTIEVTGGVAANHQNRTADLTSAGATFNGIAGFGQDARGEIYIVDLGDGDLYRIEPE